MKLLVIENDKYCQDVFEEFIAELAKSKGCDEIVYCFDAKKNVTEIVTELSLGVDYITFRPHVFDKEQWELFINHFYNFDYHRLKEMHINYSLFHFEKDLRNAIDYRFIEKVVYINSSKFRLYLSSLTLPYNEILFEEIDYKKLEDKSLLLR